MFSRWLSPRGQGLVLVAASALAALAAPLVLKPAPRLVWNASASAPIGLWRVTPGAAVFVGDTVLAEPPPLARKLAARRRYLPANVPMIKAVAAVSGDRICAAGALVSINDRPAALRRAADPRGRKLPWWNGCRRLSGGQVLLLNPTPDSFDGRYFGPVERSAVIGKARLLWRP
jgi:conjugative transfer signal peptidase TraF